MAEDPGRGSESVHPTVDEGSVAPGGSSTSPAPPVPPGDEDDSTFAGDMGRLFIIPAVIVALSVAVFFLFGLIATDRRDAHDYLQEVRNGVTGRKWQAAFELSRVLTRDEEARRDPTLSREIADTLVDPKTSDPVVRRYLLLALEEIGDPVTAPAVRRALADEDADVRLYAVRALGRLGDREAVGDLIELLSNDDPGMRKMALHSLGRIGEPSAIPAILARLDDPVEDVRWNAALSLAVLGDASGAHVIRRMLDPAYLDAIAEITEAQKIEARIGAVQAAWRLGGDEMRALVEGVSQSDPNLKVRDSALRALQEWREGA